MFLLIISLSLLAVYLALSLIALEWYRKKTGVPPAMTKSKDIYFLITLLKKLDLNHQTRILDLGSGNGRILVALAKNGYYGVGYELNPFLILESGIRAWLNGTAKKVVIKRVDFTKNKWEDVDVIFCYLYPPVMEQLKEKLHKALQQNKIIISELFPITGLKPNLVFHKFLVYSKI